ncbi:MAG: YqaE/Pmp3 family membrane protein [Leptolyngbyaceae cyanobacterium SM1_3_5]|nr:YqaE/Pmp3 family membrane protein [Leptolyngbyaceae cyanobacterium SM1_3_5]
MKATRLLLGILLPPLGIFLTYGVGPTLLISVLLTVFGWLPGSIYAVWAITKHYEQIERA